MQLYPSLLAVFDKVGHAPHLLTEAALVAEAGGADGLHLDFMAPPFTARTTFAPEIIAQLRIAGVRVPLDCHLMTGLEWLEKILPFAPDCLVFHTKMAPSLAAAQAALTQITAAGVRAGLALDHDEPVAPLADLLRLPSCQQATLLTVAAGAGGQVLRPELLAKVGEIQQIRPNLSIVVDGGVNPSTCAAVHASGAAAAVAGSAVFGAHSVAGVIKLLKNI
jgi:ribulose-phosphate 3-epimerase